MMLRLQKRVQIIIRNILLFSLPLFFMACGGEYESRDDINTTSSQSEIFINYNQKFINEHNCNQIIDNEFIVMCYDYQKKAVKAVSYTLAGDLMNEGNIEERPSYYVEKKLKPNYRISSTDYTNSGYDKGHMAPDAAFDWSEESLEAVYTLANIIPQAPQVNRYAWAKLEHYVRDKAKELGHLNIVNVVKYAEHSLRMGKHKMAISKGYYKILYNEDEKYEECFYYSNKLGVSANNDVLKEHLVSCKGISN